MATTLVVGQGRMLSAEAVESTNQWKDATDGHRNYVWSVDHPNVVEIRGAGNTVEIVGLVAGTAVVTCTVDGNPAVTENVTVNAAPAAPSVATTLIEDNPPSP